MKWFKHFTNAHNDNALKKVRMKYGADGYAIYWYCLELIAGDLDSNRANFELSHDAEVIGFDLKVDQIRVEEIMRYMVDLGLFESSNNAITCLKLAKFLDERTTRNPEILSIIKAFKQTNDVSKLSETVERQPEKVAPRLDKIRLDKNSNGKNGKRFVPPTLEEISEYIREKNYSVDPQRFINHYESNGWKVGKNKMVSWKHAVSNWQRSEPEKPSGVFYQ